MAALGLKRIKYQEVGEGGWDGRGASDPEAAKSRPESRVLQGREETGTAIQNETKIWVRETKKY